MNSRLLEIIRYKTGGKQTEFAALMGWTPQYLAKLLRGENFGITPVVTLIETLPEINARWVLTGQSEMIETPKYVDIRKTMLENMLAILDMEKFMPIMTPEELHGYEQVIAGHRKPDFSPELLEKWQKLYRLRENEINAKIHGAMRKSDKVCKAKRVNK